jgi:hypothetical protein
MIELDAETRPNASGNSNRDRTKLDASLKIFSTP